MIVRGGECVCRGLGGVGGVMECWDGERGWEGEGGWECGVMMDKMMKVEVVLEGSGVCGDCRLYKIGVWDGNRRMKNELGGEKRW